MGDIAVNVEKVSMKFDIFRGHEEILREYVLKHIGRKPAYDELWALHDITFKVGKGDSFGFIGVNGSGKTTLLKLIAGILKPTGGRIYTNGSITPLFAEDTGFDGSLTARENIFLTGALHGCTREYMRRRFDEIIDFSELGDFVDVPMRSYSSEMSSRLMFAIAAFVRTDILIVDEALSVGDARFRRKAEAQMMKMRGDGTAILFVSHSAEAVCSVCDNVIWLDRGRIVAAGRTGKTCRAYLDFCGT